MINWRLKAKIADCFGNQANFAEELGTSEPLVSYVVRGRRELKSEEKRRWSRLLKCSPKEVFSN